MNSRLTWFWIVLAGALLAFIYFFQIRQAKPPQGPDRLLPDLKASSVTAIQVRPGAPGQLALRAERNEAGGWDLTEPMVYPALATNVERLVGSLISLEAASRLGPQELRSHRNPDQEYGFAVPQASIILQQGESRAHLLVGALTPPGDQVYLQIVGREGIYVTDAQWLTNFPKSPNDWRDRALVHEDLRQFDHLAVTNNSRAFILERDAQHVWHMTWPLNPARADNARIHEGLARLQRLHVLAFVSEDASADSETTGLAQPTLEVAFGTGTNTQLVLQFGKNPPQSTNQVYARRVGKPSLFSVDSDPLAPWRSTSVNDFRDPHLLTVTPPVDLVEVRAGNPFSVQRQTNNAWRVLPDDLPADPNLVQEVISTLAGMSVIQFTKDVVNPPDLPEFGLATPARSYMIKCPAANSEAGATNFIITELSFGTVTNQPEKVYARRADETAVYAVSTNDFYRLPTHSWQLRDRVFWAFSADDVTGVLVRQGDKSRELIRNGPHQWAFAPGSQGIINDLAVEESMRGLALTSAVRWVARAPESPAQDGFSPAGYRLLIKLKNGQSLEMQFGDEAPSKNRYTAITIDGQLWVFELSWTIYRDLSTYLAIP